MPEARSRRPRPSEMVVDGTFPEGLPLGHTGAVAQHVARALGELAAELGLREVARRAGLSHATLLNIIAGRSWPDLYTISRLEEATGRPVWPRHRVPRASGDTG